jgi:hypothetical protein
MKALIILVLISFFSLSCSNQSKSGDKNNAKTKITLKDVSKEHPNKEKMESLLNNYEEEFIEEKVDLDSLKNRKLIQNIFCFKTKESGLSLYLIFCSNSENALIVGDTNFSSKENNQDYGTNGAVLFVVKGNDKYKVNSLLSYFAGEE